MPLGLGFTSTYRHGDMIETMDCKEADTLRDIGLRWRGMCYIIKMAFEAAMAVKRGRGPVRIMLVVVRDLEEDPDGNVSSIEHPQFMQQLELDEEMLRWPLS